MSSARRALLTSPMRAVALCLALSACRELTQPNDTVVVARPVPPRPSASVVPVTASDYTITYLNHARSFAFGVNELGHATGGEIGCAEQCYTGLYWADVTAAPLYIYPYSGSVGEDINEYDQVVGVYVPTGVFGPNVAYLWNPTSGITSLGHLSGFNESSAHGINDNG